MKNWMNIYIKFLYKLQKESKKYSDLINNEEKIKQTNETLRQVFWNAQIHKS